MTTGAAVQRFYPFIRAEQQWLKDGANEIGPFLSWGDAERYIAMRLKKEKDDAVQQKMG
jgi:hypothetical protein